MLQIYHNQLSDVSVCFVTDYQELLMLLFLTYFVHRVRRVQGENGDLWDLPDHL